MLFQKKCPLCSAKMVKVNGVLTCQDCGYNESFNRSSYTTTDSGETTRNTDTNTSTNSVESSRSYYQNSNSTSANPYAQNNTRPYEQYMNQSQTNNNNANSTSGRSFADITAQRRAVYGDEKPKSTNPVLVIIPIVLVIMFIVAIPAVGFFAASMYHDDDAYPSSSENYRANRAGSALADTDGYHDSSAKEKTALTVPQSEFFTQVLCYIFNKDTDALSASDSEQIVSLHIYEVKYDYIAVDYTLADGTSGTVYPVSQTPDVSEDLTCFVNLEELYLEEASYYDLNLDGLEKLHTLYFDGYLNDIENAISPSQITELGLYNTHFSLSGLGAFTNVETLYIDGDMLSDVNEILELPNLKKLTITDGDYIDDLSALYQATQLETLSIESNSLRDVSFLTKFDNLTELTIIGSEVLDFNPLADCTKLEKLYLLENYKTTDFEFVKGLTGLKEFGLMTSFNFDDSDMPDLSALSGVTKLYLGKFESFDNLKYMTNVEELIIDDGGYGDFGSNNSLLQLPNLRSLSMINSSVSPEMIQQISQVQGLECLDFHYSYLWTDISPFLNLPNLRELHLDHASFMLNTDTVAANETLHTLDMDNAIISKYNVDQWATNENLEVDKLQNALTNLHSMEVLTLESLTLNSLDFTAEMEHLKLLNITDNYVTSLAPLANLSNLQAIVCESNPISDTAGLDDILVK